MDNTKILMDRGTARLIWDGSVKFERGGRRVGYADNEQWHRFSDASEETRKTILARTGKMPADWAVFNFASWGLVCVSSDRALADEIWSLTAPAREAAAIKREQQARRAAAWTAAKPAEIDEWRRERSAVLDYYDKQQRRFEDENLSSIGMGPAPRQTTTLSDAGRAWIAIESGRTAENISKRIIYDRAWTRVVDGQQPLVDAAAQAAREWSDEALNFND